MYMTKHIRKITLKTGTFYDIRFCVNYKEIKLGRFSTLEEAIKQRNILYPSYNIIPNAHHTLLSQTHLHKILHYNAKTGIFTRKNRTSNTKVGDSAGHRHTKHGYISISIEGKQYKAHRLAFLYMTTAIPTCIDHIDGNPSNNIWTNLRGVTKHENSRNSKLRKDNKYGIIGISKDTNNRWRARISTLTSVCKLLYYGPDFFEACCARKTAEHYYNYHENHGR